MSARPKVHLLIYRGTHPVAQCGRRRGRIVLVEDIRDVTCSTCIRIDAKSAGGVL